MCWYLQKKEYKDSRYEQGMWSKGITGLTVSVGAGTKETAETLTTDLLTFFVELKC